MKPHNEQALARLNEKLASFLGDKGWGIHRIIALRVDGLVLGVRYDKQPWFDEQEAVLRQNLTLFIEESMPHMADNPGRAAILPTFQSTKTIPTDFLVAILASLGEKTPTLKLI